MKRQIFIIEKKNLLIKIAVACFLILTAGGNLFAQYKGAPVQKERLLRVLQSKQLQTRHIVAIINSNGVDFQLTPAIRKELIAAGARPAVIQAVIGNYRSPSKNNAASGKAGDNKSIGIKSPVAAADTPSYDDLLDQAMRYHKQAANPQEAMRVLKEAALLEPENPLTYQMIGFVYLYGLNDFAYAEKSMRDTIRLGGSAVFRVNHDDDGKFTRMCEGSLYISRDGVRFESDGNAHTFEASKKNVSKINISNLSTPLWDKRSVYQIVLRTGKNRAKFRFAPLTGEKAESEMVERLARWDGNSPNHNRKR
jgi:hypothetical protein